MVKLFGASWCFPCKLAKDWLNEHNIPFEYVDVESMDTNQFEIMTLPTIIKGELRITGFQKDEYAQKLL